MKTTAKMTAKMWVGAITALLLGVGFLSADTGTDLESGFRQPPAAARPWVYWFWLNSNITKQGITADLEAMQRVGIGGVLIMEVDQGAPVGPVPFMGPQWREMFQHVVAEAQRLGLEVNMNNDAGWNGSGGPWIGPQQSMQEVVWSESELTGPQHFDGVLPQPKVTADYYRDIVVQAFPSVANDHLPGFEGKAAFQSRGLRPATATDVAPPRVVPRDRIVELTAQMDSHGRLVWGVPEGTWTVVRVGHTSTGVENAPAPASGRGLECDKLSRQGIEASFAGMMDKLIADVGPAAGQTLTATHIDSWENGSQNWTLAMRDEFRQRRGYDMTPLLPVMTGRVVDSVAISERFLWDVRQTVSELVIDHYAGRMRELAAAQGLRFTVEAYGSPCDHLPYAGQADEPMGEFWIGGGAIDTCRGMASAAHVYGKPIVGAEAFTADNTERWQQHPASLKPLGDRALCDGINRFVFHRYALQPWADYRPGMTMGPWGVHYERTQTWWDWAVPWHEYLARCQFLLRQGRFVADICYLQPEAPPYGFARHPQQGYGWDECSADVVLRRMTVQNGRLCLPDGMSYRVLVLPETSTMTPALLRRITELVAAGATVIGSPPVQSPSLSGYPQCDDEVKRLANQLWGSAAATPVGHTQPHGQGRIVQGIPPERLLAQDGVPPDFTSRARLRWIHRAVDGTDLYFVANPLPHAVNASGAFRVSGQVPELWWPDSGRIEPAAVYDQRDGVTRVLLPLEAHGSVFVVFRQPVAPRDTVVAAALNGQPWCSADRAELVPLVIEKAIYGVPGDAQRSRDVREKLQNYVDTGERSFAVSQMADGDDPAPSVLKTLTVDYRIGDRRFTVSGQDRDRIHLTGEALKIVVTKASYGVLDDPVRTRDMRAVIQRIVDSGETSFEVARLAAGDDPAFGVVKTLLMEYTHNDRSFTVRATDPETVDLALLEPAAEPPAQIHLDANGQITLDAAQPGRYELQSASGKVQQVEIAALPSPLELSGPWDVHFDPRWGGPDAVTFPTLQDWSQHADTRIRYYSGTATYRTTFAVADPGSNNQRLVLDLGQVAVMADVRVNDRPLGILWKAPFRIDVTDALQSGNNVLEVRIVNLWINRMIGDQQLSEDSQRNPDGTLQAWPQWVNEGKPSPAGRYTFTSWRLWQKDEPLQPSGLLGPVRLLPVTRCRL